MIRPVPVGTKEALRRYYLEVRGSLSSEERAAAEAAILTRLFAEECWQRARVICAYLPIRGELDTTPILRRAEAEGKLCALPVTVTGAAEGKMIFRSLLGLSPEALPKGRFGIPEPPPTHPTLSPAALEGALVLVPGLAFDDDGFRIGYGGGYYDRFLSTHREAGISLTAVGLAYGVCRAPSLPREPHDVPVDFILDERRSTRSHDD